jgi:4-aminobutyrate aminotransferase-like enzyme
MTMVNAFRPENAAGLDEAERALVARRERVLGPAYRLFYEHPVHVVRGEGVWLYGPAGERYLDVYNNVPSVGHCHPAVVEAVSRQSATLVSHTRYLHEAILDTAEALAATMPPELSQVMLTCSGSEANDLAYRIASVHTGGTGVIVTANAYHGVTAAVSAFSPSLGFPDGRPPHVRVVPAPDPTLDAAAAGARFAGDVAAAAVDLAGAGIRPAMLIVDTIFSSDGVIPGPRGVLAPAAEAIRAAGGLFVADEVQPGFGRTGDGLWGFSRHGVVPDLVTLGKPMGNGYPVAGIVFRPEVAERFGRRMRYFNTFGGNPVAAAAARAVLRVIADERLVDNARDVGAHLAARLRELAAGNPRLGAVRAAGLYLGVDVVDPSTGAADPAGAAHIVNALREARILISASGPAGNVLKLRPPLPFARAEADYFADVLGSVLPPA